MTSSTLPNLGAYVEFVTNAAACCTDKGLLFSAFVLGQGWSLRTSRWGLCRNFKWFEGRRGVPQESVLLLASGSLSWLVTKMSASARPKSSPWICWTIPYPPKSGMSRVFFREGKKKLSIALQTSWTTNAFPASPGKADDLIWSFRHSWRTESDADSWWTYDKQVSFRPRKLAWGCLRGNCIWGAGSTQRWWRQKESWLKPLRIGCDPQWGWRGASSDSALMVGARVWVDFMEHLPEGWL